MIVELIEPTFDAVSTPRGIPRNYAPGAVVTIFGTGMTGSDEIYIWYRSSSTASWERVRDYQNSGALVTITATSGPVTLKNAAMRYGVTKNSGTGYPFGVYAAVQDASQGT